MITHLHVKNLLKIMFFTKIKKFSNHFPIMHIQEYQTFLRNTNLGLFENFFPYGVEDPKHGFAQGRKHCSTFQLQSFTGLNLKRCVSGKLVSLPYV